jgi:hypothetical protein
MTAELYPVIASGAKQSRGVGPGLLRRFAPRNDGVGLPALMAGHVIAPPRHCERNEAIQDTAPSWIASSLYAPCNDGGRGAAFWIASSLCSSQ